MKRYFGVIVLIAGVLFISVSSYRSQKARVEEAQREADLERVQREYLERVGWLRANPDADKYRQEVGSFFKAYFARVSEHQERFGGNPEFDSYLQELEARAEEGSDARLADRKAFYEYARKVFDSMRKGDYRPVWTATDQGMRLDVLSSDVVMVMGRPQVRMQLVLWGAQREVKEDGKSKRMLTSASFNTKWVLQDTRGKLVGEMKGEDPSMKIDHPERFISEFPPQMVLGHYDIDLLPDNVAKMEVTFEVGSRSASGGAAAAKYVWKMDVPAEWKLKPGEEWKGAEVEERSKEEIEGAQAGD